MTTTGATWQAWLGSRASIWSHRGYEVRGETVYTESRADALRIARESLGEDVVEVRADDGTYLYADADSAARDDDGSSADAVVSRVEEE